MPNRKTYPKIRPQIQKKKILNQANAQCTRTKIGISVWQRTSVNYRLLAPPQISNARIGHLNALTLSRLGEALDCQEHLVRSRVWQKSKARAQAPGEYERHASTVFGVATLSLKPELIILRSSSERRCWFGFQLLPCNRSRL